MFYEKRLAGTRTAILGAAVVFLTVFSTYLVTRLQATYALATQMGRLDQRVDAFVRAQETRDQVINDLLMQLSQTVWAPLEATPLRRPSTVEVWQLNRDKELRSRLSSLETRFYQLDAQQEKLLRAVEDVRAGMEKPK